MCQTNLMHFQDEMVHLLIVYKKLPLHNDWWSMIYNSSVTVMTSLLAQKVFLYLIKDFIYIFLILKQSTFENYPTGQSNSNVDKNKKKTFIKLKQIIAPSMMSSHIFQTTNEMRVKKNL